MHRISLLLNVLFKTFNQSPLFDNLNRPLSFNDSNQNLWNDNCDYVQVDELKDINWTGHNMTVLQLNICGGVSKKSDLINLLDNCKKKNKIWK